MLNEVEDRIFYSSGHYLQKILIGLKCLFKRLRDAKRARKFEFTYIYREAFFFGTFIEKRVKRSGTKIIYDFDDAIWLEDLNPNQGFFNKLKTPEKVSELIKLSYLTLVGNKYLADYAKQFNENVSVVPSTIDFRKYAQGHSVSDQLCIGWTGSFSTLKHFEWVFPALKQIHDRFGERVKFKLIGIEAYSNEDLPIESIPWNSESEVNDLSELDIGIMPLPDNLIL